MSLNYVTHERTVTPAKIYNDPYLRVEIEQIDHNYTVYNNLAGWTRNHACETGNWDGGSYVRPATKGSYNNVDLTKKIDISSKGWYRVYVRVKRGVNCAGKKIRLYVDNELVDKPYECGYSEYHWKMVDLGLVYLNTGSRTFKLNVEKPVTVGNFFLYKINKHNSNDLTDYARKLDIQSLEYTQNGVTELNTLSMPVTLKEEYYDENSPSRFVFDGYTNSITVWMGEERRTAKAMFGGYITGLTDADDTLTIKAADRLIDFYREPLLLNFNINTNAKSDTTKLFPYVQKNTIYDAVRYIAECNEEGINTSGLEQPTAFYWNFSTKKQFDSLPVSGYTKVWDKRARSPNPCLRLGVGKKAGSASVTLFDSPEDPFDANVNNILSFDYMYSSKSAKYPTEMHFAVDMYKEGETSDDAVTYNILFNSKEGSGNVIGKITPVYNGKWNTVKFNLANAFDSYAPSAEYNITKIRIFDTVSSAQVKNRLRSAIWLDNFTVYDDIRNVKSTTDQEGAYPFEVIQKLCDESEYNLWVDYGDSRRDDILVLKSDYDDVSEIIALPSNTVEIGDVEYNMYDHNVRNSAKMMYHPTVSKTKKVAHVVKRKPSKKKYKKIYVKENGKTVRKYEYYTYTKEKVKVNVNEDEEVTSSYIRYRGWRHFEDLTEVTKETDAHRNATVFLNEHNTAPYGFSVTMRGTTQLYPNQYLLVSSDRRRLSGLHKIKAITHNYDKSRADKWQTQIDLGIPSKRFRNLVLNMKKNINRLDNKSKGIVYTADQLTGLGVTSPGAFI